MQHVLVPAQIIPWSTVLDPRVLGAIKGDINEIGPTRASNAVSREVATLRLARNYSPTPCFPRHGSQLLEWTTCHA